MIFPYPNCIASASRDATVRVWKTITEGEVVKFDDKIIQHGTSFINAIAYLPPKEDEYLEGLIVSGGKESIIEVRQPSKAAEDSAEAVLLGHAGNVCSLDVSPEGKYIVSGGWDQQARLWRVGKWETETEFKGHDGSVWAVLAYDEETVITGCADNAVRIFHTSGKLLKKIMASDQVIRALCRLPAGHASGAHFASAGNDGIIRLWTLDGKRVAELLGHENFIYSLATLPSGELVSAGEDRTVRIWRDSQCVQTITHPAISVWSVSANPDSGDIVTGASDRIVRVFTRDIDRIANPETVAAFEESVKASAIPQQTAGNINKEQLPGPDFLVNKSGTKEGQVQMIKEHDGSVSAHQWSSGQKQWINIGTVVDAVASSGKKTSFSGKQYDYVFDVDIEEGKPPLKLPYNLSQNPYEAAQKFIEDNELPIAYLDQVANFITTNTQGATIGAGSSSNDQPAPAGSDPWGSENRYRPGGGSASSAPHKVPKILPQTEYLNILVARADMMEKKIKELNHELIKSGLAEYSLSSAELGVLKHLIRHIEESGSTASSQNIGGGLDVAIKLATKWEYAKRLPGLDLLRLLAVAPNTATYRSEKGESIIDILDKSVNEQDPPAENNAMLAIRAFGNLFGSVEGRQLALLSFDKIFAMTYASLKSKTTNRNLLVAVVTLAINYAVLLTSKAESILVDDAKTFEYSTSWLDLLSKILKEQKDSEVLYRALVATGTFLLVEHGDEIKLASKEVYGIEEAVNAALKNAVTPRDKTVGKELLAMLQGQ